MTITIKLKTGNAAFRGEDDGADPDSRDVEIRRILREWLHNGRMSDAPLRDSNGNTVGSITVTGR